MPPKSRQCLKCSSSQGAHRVGATGQICKRLGASELRDCRLGRLIKSQGRLHWPNPSEESVSAPMLAIFGGTSIARCKSWLGRKDTDPTKADLQ